MEKIMLKSGLYWGLSQEGIFFNYTNKKLKKMVKSNDDKKLFELLKFIGKPKSKKEINIYALNNNIESIDEIIVFLQENHCIEIITDEFQIENKDKRIANFIGSFPQISYKDYKGDCEQLNICILGIGTAGSYTVEALIKMGFKNITIIDNDLVEEHNLISQNFCYSDIGKLKTQVLKEKYQNEFNINIIAYEKFIKSFDDLNKTVDIMKYNYLLLFADDYLLTLDIIENIFEVNSKIKLIQSGYSNLEVESIVISRENYKNTLSILKNDYKSYQELSDVIVQNSGTVLEAFIIAFTTCKQILDDILKLNLTELMKVDLLENNYFLGSRFEFLYTHNTNNIKKFLYDIGDTEYRTEFPWIKEINASNIFEDNKIFEPKLQKGSINYLIEKERMSFVNKLIDIKDNVKNVNLGNYYYPIEEVKDHILKHIKKYIKSKFDKKIFELFEKSIANGYIYTYKNKYSSNQGVTLKSNGNIYVFKTLDGESTNYNMLIHELLHLICYFLGESDDFNHENFVFKHHIYLLNENKSDVVFSNLIDNFIYNNIHTYITNTISLDYEKYTLLNNIEQFRNIWGDIPINELVYILVNNINRLKPLNNMKYMNAIEKNKNIFIELIEYYLSRNNIKIKSVN
ncbi:ThiF family adenylyltransferase [Mammaliicoccus sciuri]|uniref:ThiF family adenylyltransferase n=1 Tax=Mammaliicoccus sciuri TaxID=1296 RepID=UPI001E30937C|nr:ThiF family adenylyltransferase [Mammaliicoccus sciuri]MCD8875230.1 ThiF family adenylyltransferase [Mammaliicoccus sciuri]